jgi:branched-chain amino acid transport system permease protein
MLGGMICHTVLTRFGVPILVAALVTIPVVALFGIVIETVVVRPMLNRGAPLFAIVLATLATQVMIERATILTLGDQTRTFDEFTSGGPLRLGSIAVSYQLFWILGCGAVVVILLMLFFMKTSAGRALRACSQNREAAALLGIPVSRMLILSFALSAAIGAIAGILVTPTQVTSFSAGGSFGVAGFIAAIIGGFGSVGGALAGGVILGLLQAAAIVVFGASFKNVTALSVLLIILFVFPKGVFAGFKGKAH